MVWSDREVRARAHWILGKSEALTRTTLRERQNEYLRVAVRNAATSVPFYREKFKRAGVEAEQITDVASLRQIPVTTRAQLQRASPDEVISEWARRESLKVTRTSGSTGRPLSIWQSPAESFLYSNVAGRLFSELGVRYGPDLASVLLSSSDQAPEHAYLENGRIVVDCRMTPERIAAELARVSPQWVAGFPGAICAAAQRGAPEHLAKIRPRLVVLGGEVITQKMREIISDAFQAPVTSTYACTEAQWMAWECEHTGALHVVDSSVVMEILDDEGNPVPEGEEGDVVITTLHSLAQPFIRYKIGDRATQGAEAGGEKGCACGSPHSTIQNVVGRMNDVLILPGGVRRNAYLVTRELLAIAPFVARYQLVQEREDWLRYCVIPSYAPTDEEVARVVAHSREVLGPGVRFDVEFVERFEQEKSGKFRLVLSKIESHFEG